MNGRVKARRPIGLMVFATAIAFFFATAGPASAQDSTDNNNEHGRKNYSATVHGNCEVGFAVTIKNDSHHDIDVLIRLNGVDTVVEVDEESTLMVHPLAVIDDVPNTIFVKVGDNVLVEKSFTVHCLPDPTSKLSASISSDCGSYAVTVKNEGDADGTATVTVNGSSVNLDVAAGKTVTMKVVLNEDADNTIAVTAGDTSLAHTTIHVDCTQELPPPTTTAPPAAPPVEVLDETVTQPQTLAFTGRSTVFEAMIGVALLGLGLQLMRSSRRLEQS